MGAVKSRNITTADVEADDQQHHPQHSSHSMLRNGHHNHNGPASGGGTLQKQDLRYDIGSSAEYHHIRQPSVRSRSQQPMPTTDELDRRFAKVLASMDLPPDKAKLLRNYDDEKKWDMICDQEMVQAKDPPSHYLSRLRTYLDPKASRSHRKRKMVGESTSTQVLRDLEISLRTNHIEWVKEFLDDSNQGLDALVDYLSFRLQMMQHEQRLQGALCASEERLNLTSGGDGVEMVLSQNSSLSPPQSQPHAHTHNGGLGNGSFLLLDSSRQQHVSYGFLRPTIADALDSPSLKRRSRHIAKLNMGAATDDIHVSIMCLRAIMNNKYGFNMVIQHREAINCIALSLIHKSLRTKALVLELLAAICLVKGGHEIILGSFDNFKDVCQEQRRFQTLMEYFMNFEAFNIDFMVACMQFMNIVVHSVEDMNYRVHLQYEFTALGLDKYLERIRLTESEELKVQISAYLDNVFDVAALMEDSETKTSALERVQELDDQLEREIDRNSEFLYKFAELETENINLKTERDQLTVARQNLEEELTALQRMLQQNEQELQKRDTLLRTKNQELQTLSRSLPRSASSGDGCLTNGGLQAGATSGSDSPLPPPLPLPMTTAAAAPPPPPPPAPPAPPPPPMMPGMGLSPLGSPNGSIASTAPSPPLAQPMLSSFPPPPPPVAGFMPAPDGAMTIKRKVPTKYKLPTLNWIPLKPNQVRGTIFNELDDEKIFKQIDFNEFEERFKIGSIGGALLNGTTGSEVDGSLQSSKRFKRPDNVSLLEHTRLRNIAISRRKLGMPIDDVVAAIQGLDLKKLSLENVELLQKMVPTDVEIKAYKEYIIARKDPQLLTEEDRFMLQLSRVERISFKLSIMNYMGNFIDSVHLISPQVQSIAGASNSLKQSRKFRAVLEIVLAFGNYLNSNKRGPAYGFKLQSLDTLIDTKSTDKRSSLLHYIVATIRAKFPELLNYETELQCTDKAALVALENVVADVHELDKGMDQVRKEAELRVKGTQTHILRDFLNNTEDKLKKIKSDLRHAQEAFKECVEYFGESSRTADAAAFFSLIVRFTRAFKQHDQENEQRRRLEQAAALAASKKENNAQVLMRNKHNQKKQQDAVINELKTKAHSVREKKLLQQDEVYNGALEDILLGLKSEPYRRADAVRRSQRRRIDNNRLSRTLEEMDC
ncbi:formin-like protein isoform X2 [Drosophila guanche]|uniref:Blast:Formin-like protein CG32138 n=1 Tax=Drosophila guanche TaxID=7266 RepID=A0A3B0J3B9_DROGU|nr:formin-like protein isoform X2 [Drosophila guanche]SPP76104.1 blast:Formin-like protein CG32138 [Drosophila guanche]